MLLDGMVLRIYWKCIENVLVLLWEYTGITIVSSDEYWSDNKGESAEKILIDITL